MQDREVGMEEVSKEVSGEEGQNKNTMSELKSKAVVLGEDIAKHTSDASAH